jgi:hypothetical protein
MVVSWSLTTQIAGSASGKAAGMLAGAALAEMPAAARAAAIASLRIQRVSCPADRREEDR